MQKIYPGICNGCLAICGVEAAESSLHFAVVNAARKYDDGYNVKFESFCWRQIAAQFQEDIRRETLHLSRNQVAAVDVPVADPDRPDPLGRELLGKLVNRLPKRYRRTVIVCYGLDRKTPPKPHEAAKILRINRKQMEQRLEMALNLMRIYYMQGLHQDVN
jgi:DNA-directed RNA polymerase specialized sigma24 family protein